MILKIAGVLLCLYKIDFTFKERLFLKHETASLLLVFGISFALLNSASKEPMIDYRCFLKSSFNFYDEFFSRP